MIDDRKYLKDIWKTYDQRYSYLNFKIKNISHKLRQNKS